MVEIIPNWHPILVHFTIALFAIATGLFFLGSIFSQKPWSETLLKTAHINLWIGAAITVLTLLAGWDAYNTVMHDTPSHAAMTNHRNWALTTAVLFFVITFWSLLTYRKTIRVGVLFLILITVASGLLATASYKGGEVVYRYGIGVLSMPKATRDGGHLHGEENNHGNHSSESSEQNNESKDSDYGKEKPHDDDHTH